MQYERPIELGSGAMSRRIFSPFAYAAVREARLINIVCGEAATLAPHYPLAWHRRDDRHQLVMIRALMASEAAGSRGPHRNLSLLPLLAQAYPFMLKDVRAVGPARFDHALDDTMADQPTDVGAPISTSDGRPGIATQQRTDCLRAFAQDWPLTAEIADALERDDLFERWPLRFEVETHVLEIEDLYIVRQSAFESGRLAPLVMRFGMDLAEFLAWHRLSLFRAGALVASARSVLADQSTTAGAKELPSISSPSTASEMAPL